MTKTNTKEGSRSRVADGKCLTRPQSTLCGLRVMTQKQHFVVMEAGNNKNHCHFMKVFVASAPVLLKFNLWGPD